MSKIGIPVREKSMNSSIDDRFARAPFILIYDTNTKVEEWIDNSETEAHGAGPKMVQNLISRGVEVIIAPQLGENAFMAIQAGGLKAYGYQGDSVRRILENYEKGILVEIRQAKVH